MSDFGCEKSLYTQMICNKQHVKYHYTFLMKSIILSRIPDSSTSETAFAIF